MPLRTFQNGSEWFRMVQNGSKWFRMVQNEFRMEFRMEISRSKKKVMQNGLGVWFTTVGVNILAHENAILFFCHLPEPHPALTPLQL